MILVTGATGFVGRHLISRLLQAGKQVRALTRGGAQIAGVELARGDVRDLAALVPAARGCESVIHLVGIIREQAGASFRAIHVGGTRTVVQACEEAGVGRLVHVSALGTRPGARSRYHRSKWEAEEIVRGSGLSSTIFRPSLIFGAGNSFLPQMRGLLQRGPLIPIIGDGMALLQPVWVEDVVSCVVGALERPETTGQSYELGGPEAYGFEQLVDLLAQTDGVRKPKLHLPPTLVRVAAGTVGRLLPGFPITSDQVSMLLEDNVCDITDMRQVFGVEPVSLTGHLDD